MRRFRRCKACEAVANAMLFVLYSQSLARAVHHAWNTFLTRYNNAKRRVSGS
jgi:hypothetical protein